MTRKEQSFKVSEIIKNNFINQNEVRVLEAGCGSATRLEIPKHYKLIGIDISEKQLERNQTLTEKIQGDIQEYPLKAESYDMIISWFVLEHIKYPQKVLQNFKRALKPNGLIVLALPNVWSIKALAAKFTPQFVHVWFARYIGGKKLAGKDDNGPFKTFLRLSISPENIMKFADKNNFKVEYFGYRVEAFLSKKVRDFPLIHGIQAVVGAFFWTLSFGKITQKNTDFIIVLKKLN